MVSILLTTAVKYSTYDSGEKFMTGLGTHKMRLFWVTTPQNIEKTATMSCANTHNIVVNLELVSNSLDRAVQE